MKEKTAKIIRIITIPPIEALAMLLILYGTKQEEFGNMENLRMAVLFLTVIPICSYPIASRKRDKQDMRNNQRNMAFIFNFEALGLNPPPLGGRALAVFSSSRGRDKIQH